MKKTDIKLTPQDYIKELRREMTMRIKVYNRKVQAGQMAQYEANKKFLIIRNLAELLELMNSRGLTVDELAGMLRDIPSSRRVQGNLFTDQQVEP